MLSTIGRYFDIGNLEREQARFADLHADLQEELFSASEACTKLSKLKKTMVREGNQIYFIGTDVSCHETEVSTLRRQLDLTTNDSVMSSVKETTLILRQLVEILSRSIVLTRQSYEGMEYSKYHIVAFMFCFVADVIGRLLSQFHEVLSSDDPTTYLSMDAPAPAQERGYRTIIRPEGFPLDRSPGEGVLVEPFPALGMMVYLVPRSAQRDNGTNQQRLEKELRIGTEIVQVLNELMELMLTHVRWMKETQPLPSDGSNIRTELSSPLWRRLWKKFSRFIIRVMPSVLRGAGAVSTFGIMVCLMFINYYFHV
ncbi:uncharacterized protein MONOS_9985 [Monocercomonoides exilis]|uniref:uncharacterized protein n=1 Tax=Monocercomonoides exilis TaxID=2049356 RepID=UPI00355A1EB9|nr:hypothetical protein MONOS_9985 [Monocercomonoides exilis]|eukprot:MONOS_9985.1-p1 / transcript=MONOS_9985.1 / gene=MONOS_9985 / organism=Monocercomonoides_exilis_PA203 / gene_product=hypothetical protein / transcript_product=hypothetical protein / location=Mono_scaffold00433:50536-51553(+) / protein_length=312 / sequence_SO=supercontig / SO=protein_coding / is_pseudo=false